MGRGYAPFRYLICDGTRVMCWQQQHSLSPAPSAAGVARSTLVAELGDRLGHTDAADTVQFDVSVVVSELVANAVQAGCTSLVMSVQAHRSSVRLAVSDDAPGLPRMASASVDDLHGRGLTLVAALAVAWGVDLDAHGKAVWAELAVPPDALGTGPLEWCDQVPTVAAARP